MANLCQTFRSFLKLFAYPGEAVYTRTRYTTILDSTQSAERFFRKIWNKERFNIQEEFYVVFVDDDNQVIIPMLLHTGLEDECSIDVKLLFMNTFKYKASGLFIAHNHPRKSIKASAKDRQATREIKQLCDRFKIRLLDHLILGDNKYYSFYESDLLD